MTSLRTLTVLLFIVATLTGCGGQDAAWQEAEDAGTIAAYQEFIETYPDSPRAEEAEERIRALQSDQAWQQAREGDSLEAYRQFVAEYPDTEEAEQARSRIAELERQQAWQELRDSSDLEALRSFAQRHQGAPEAEQAQQRIEELEAAAREAEAREQARLEAEQERRRAEEATNTHRVQLAAFRSEARAGEGVTTLEQRFSDQLGDTGIEIQQAGSMYVLRTEPMPQEEASRLCDRLKQADQDCLVVRR